MSSLVGFTVALAVTGDVIKNVGGGGGGGQQCIVDICSEEVVNTPRNATNESSTTLTRNAKRRTEAKQTITQIMKATKHQRLKI